MSDTDPTEAPGGASGPSGEDAGSSGDEGASDASGGAVEPASSAAANETSGSANLPESSSTPSSSPAPTPSSSPVPDAAAAGAGGGGDAVGGGGSGGAITAATPASGPAPKRPRARRTRTIISWILVVLASLLIPIAVMSAWAIRTVTNTDQYVATMAPLARNQVIVNHLADKATDALFSSGTVQHKIEDALPPKAKPVIAPITAEVKNYVHGLALKVFESPKFGQLWDFLNRHTHEAVVSVLEGKHNELLSKIEKNGQIVLNVSPTLQQIIDKADARGITIFNPVKAALSHGDHGVAITVVSTEQVSKYSGYFNLLVNLGWWVPVIAIALGVLAIVVAWQRRRTLLRVAVGVSLFTLLLLGLLATGRNVFLSKVTEQSQKRDVAAAVWDTVLRNLKTDFRWMLLAAVLVALVAWVFGPARWAVAIRSAFARAGRWIAAQTRGLSNKTGEAAAGSSGTRRTGAWVQEHINLLRIIGVVVAALFLLFGGNLTGWGLLIIVIVLAVYLALLQLIVVWARRVSGGPRTPATPGVS